MAEHDEGCGRDTDAVVPLHVCPEELLRTLTEPVEARLDGMVDMVVDAIQKNVERYRTLSGEELEAVRWGIASTIRLHLRTLVEDRDLSAEEIGLEARSKFLASLLSGEFDTEEEIERAAHDRGCALEAPYGLVAFAVTGDGSAQKPSQRLGGLRSVLSDGLVSETRLDPHPHAVAVVPLRGRSWLDLTTAVGEHLEDAGLVALAEPAASLTDLADLYAGIRDRVTVMHRFPARARVLRAVDLTLVWAASRAGEQARFLDVDSVLGPVLARRRDWAGRDMATLTALRDHRGDVVVVARHLGVDVAEVHRKLRGIERRTGLDFGNPVDVATLSWALSLYWADPGSLPAPGDTAWGRAARADETVREARVE